MEPLGKVSLASAEEALAVLRRDHFQTILVDSSIVEEPGTLVSRIRMQQHLARVIVLTATTSWQSARAAFRAGASDCILKSLDRSHLEIELKRAINRPVLPWPR